MQETFPEFNITYPCIVLDIGTSRLSKKFDTDDIRTNNLNIDLFEAAFGLIEDKNAHLDSNNIFYIDIQNNPQQASSFIDAIDPFLSSHTVISHNAATDLKILQWIYLSVGRAYPTSSPKYFCTMEHGREFSTTHVYRNGKKIKKWPHLQELLGNLTGERVFKGTIIDDILQCYVDCSWSTRHPRPHAAALSNASGLMPPRWLWRRVRL